MAEDPETHVAMDWSMKMDGGALVVDLTVMNKSAHPIYVPDTLLMNNPSPIAGGYARAPGRLVVSDEGNGVAQLMFGVAGPSNPIAFIVPPIVQELAPGTSTSKTFRLRLPLAAWHNVGWNFPFERPPTHAFLSLWYVLETPEPEWHEIKDETGATVMVPLRGNIHTLDGERKPIPSV